MLTFAAKYHNNIYSQNGEDGILSEVLYRIGITKGVCVEFGAADGKFCSNTYYLLQQGWKGVMIESDKELYDALKDNVRLLDCMPLKDMVTPDNINVLLPGNIDVLSIDTDGKNDYLCLQSYRGDAKIVIIEINSSKEPTVGYLNEGASYISMLALGIIMDYFLLCHTGNMIFVRNEYRQLFPEIIGDGIENWEEYFNKKWL